MPETPDEELVRRLLAEARHDEPLPADVATRLDSVLADLAAERDAATVTTLRPQTPVRRRRRAATVAAAAAVVAVVGGVALGQLRTGDGNDGAGTAADSSAGGSAENPADNRALGEAPERAGVAQLHRATLAADVRRAAARSISGSAVRPPSSNGSLPCDAPDSGPGTLVPARLDGDPALLALRPPARGRQVAEVLQCGTGRVLASVTLEAR